MQAERCRIVKASDRRKEGTGARGFLAGLSIVRTQFAPSAVMIAPGREGGREGPMDRRLREEHSVNLAACTVQPCVRGGEGLDIIRGTRGW